MGNRLHLAFKRQVPTEQAQAYAERLGVTFFEVSPLCNFNITESFTELARTVLLRHGMDRLWRPSKGRHQPGRPTAPRPWSASQDPPQAAMSILRVNAFNLRGITIDSLVRKFTRGISEVSVWAEVEAGANRLVQWEGGGTSPRRAGPLRAGWPGFSPWFWEAHIVSGMIHFQLFFFFFAKRGT